MDAPGIARLTDAQRVALRLFMERKTAKQIAIELGITPKAVELRLKGARGALGVATSAEAARLLAAAEQENSTFRETLGDLTEVADPAISLPLSDIDGKNGRAVQPQDRQVLSETHTASAQQPVRLQAGLGWPFPSEGGGRNELGLAARLLWPFLAICGIGVSIGTLVICGSLLSLAYVAVLHALR